MTKDLRVNADRMLASFNQLALIGATAEGGVHRLTFSEAHLTARKWFREEIARSSLDGAGNHSAFLATAGRVAPHDSGGVYRDQTLLLGSHLDSVPNGGRFDGALGVIAALEVLRTIKESEINLKVNLEAIDFTDEEGTLVGLLGSAAIAGHFHPEMLQSPRGGRENLVEGMQRAGLSDEDMLGAPERIICGIFGIAHRTRQTTRARRNQHWHRLCDCWDLVVSAVVHRARRPRGLNHNG